MYAQFKQVLLKAATALLKKRWGVRQADHEAFVAAPLAELLERAPKLKALQREEEEEGAAPRWVGGSRGWSQSQPAGLQKVGATRPAASRTAPAHRHAHLAKRLPHAPVPWPCVSSCSTGASAGNQIPEGLQVCLCNCPAARLGRATPRCETTWRDIPHALRIPQDQIDLVLPMLCWDYVDWSDTDIPGELRARALELLAGDCRVVRVHMCTRVCAWLHWWLPHI